MTDCRVTITVGGVVQVDNEPFGSVFPPFEAGPLNTIFESWECFVDYYVQDWPDEGGGDKGVYLAIGRDNNCQSFIQQTVIEHDMDCDDEQFIADGNSCDEVVVTLDCNPLP